MLLKVSLAMQQGKGSKRNSQIGRGAERVTGQHAQAARVSGHCRVDGDLH
jgi:hypothetical protein